MNKKLSKLAICISLMLVFLLPVNLYAEDTITENGVDSEDIVEDMVIEVDNPELGVVDKGTEVSPLYDDEELIASSVDTNESDIVDSGMLLDNNTYWSLNNAGQLVFSGNGEMRINVFNPEPYASYQSQIKEIIFENSITSIGGKKYAFSGYNVDKVVIPDSVTEVSGTLRFLHTKELIVSTNTNTDGSLLESGCPQKITFTGSGEVSIEHITGSTSARSELTEVTLGNSISSIAKEGFYYCDSINSITVPASCKTIGAEAFCGCTSLKQIKLSDEISTIGENAFEQCTSLISFSMPQKCSSISAEMFYGCTNLSSVVLTNKVTSIGDYAFLSCKSLTSIVIPSSVNTIGRGAFSGCSNLSNITLPGNLNVVSASLFERCSSLKNVKIPDSVTSIGEAAFDHCSSLTSVNIPASIKTVRNEAFNNCIRLRNINLVAVNDIGYSAFGYCSSLETVNLGGTNISIGSSAFYNCKQLYAITGKASFTSIGNDAFAYCSSLKKINLGNSLKTIGSGVFDGCCSGFTTTIPATVDSIGSKAFTGKSYIYVKCPPPKTVTSAFSIVTGIIYTSCSSNEWDYAERQLWNSDVNRWDYYHEHTKHVVVPPTENNDGMEYDICVNCGTMMNYKSIPKSSGETNYSPTLKVSVKISKPKATKGAITIKWKKVSKKNQKKIQGLQIQYATSYDFSNAKTVKAGKKKSSKKIKKLSRKTIYYVRVRAYKGSSYSAWSAVKKVKTK